jgi:predicted PurR-regulated permease PerM
MGLAVLGVYCVIHGLEGNVITPALVGHQVNLNPLASLIAVLLGGAIWGPAGMLLFIPIVGMMVLALEVSPEGIPLARLLGNVPRSKNKTGAWGRLTQLKPHVRT